MTLIKETLWDRFFNRLPETVANEAVQTLKKGGSYRDIDFFTLKESEAQVARLRARAQAAIGDYRNWKAGQSAQTFMDVFRTSEGTALRKHARSMAILYADARRDHRDLTDLLMASIDEDRKQIGGGHAQ